MSPRVSNSKPMGSSDGERSTDMNNRSREGKRAGVVARLGGAAVAVVIGLSMTVPALSTNAGASSKKVTLSIAFGSTYVMATAALAPKFYGNIAKEFEATHPGVTVDLIPIPGSPNDIITKLSLLYRSASTAPTIAEIDNLDVGKFASAGYLLPLNKYVSQESWWSSFPKVVQDEAELNGKYYGVNQGENVQALAYNKDDFKEAGLPVPWHPTTWQDIINAALTIKKKLPKVTPIWAEGGTGAGTGGISLGVANLLAGSSDPTVYDKSTGKWVVNSSGLKQTFSFIHTLTVDGLNAPVSDLFNPNAPGNATAYMKSPGAAIAIASNYWTTSWLENDAPSWPQAKTEIGITPLPTSDGQGSDIASLLTGWDQAIYSGTPNAKLAFSLLNFMMQKQNLLTVDNDGEWIPPVTSYATDPLYTNFGAPFQSEFAGLEKYASEWPDVANLPVWSQAFQDATGNLEQNSSTTVQDALNTMQSYVSEQLGSSAVETKK
jgi:multiple sugar transport system substrate-binding protein